MSAQPSVLMYVAHSDVPPSFSRAFFHIRYLITKSASSLPQHRLAKISMFLDDVIINAGCCKLAKYPTSSSGISCPQIARQGILPTRFL